MAKPDFSWQVRGTELASYQQKVREGGVMFVRTGDVKAKHVISQLYKEQQASLKRL